MRSNWAFQLAVILFFVALSHTTILRSVLDGVDAFHKERLRERTRHPPGVGIGGDLRRDSYKTYTSGLENRERSGNEADAIKIVRTSQDRQHSTWGGGSKTVDGRVSNIGSKMSRFGTDGPISSIPTISSIPRISPINQQHSTRGLDGSKTLKTPVISIKTTTDSGGRKISKETVRTMSDNFNKIIEQLECEISKTFSDEFKSTHTTCNFEPSRHLTIPSKDSHRTVYKDSLRKDSITKQDRNRLGEQSGVPRVGSAIGTVSSQETREIGRPDTSNIEYSSPSGGAGSVSSVNGRAGQGCSRLLSALSHATSLFGELAGMGTDVLRGVYGSSSALKGPYGLVTNRYYALNNYLRSRCEPFSNRVEFSPVVGAGRSLALYSPEDYKRNIESFRGIVQNLEGASRTAIQGAKRILDLSDPLCRRVKELLNLGADLVVAIVGRGIDRARILTHHNSRILGPIHEKLLEGFYSTKRIFVERGCHH